MNTRNQTSKDPQESLQLNRYDRECISNRLLDRLSNERGNGLSLPWVRAALGGGFQPWDISDDALLGLLAELGFEIRKHRCTLFVTL